MEAEQDRVMCMTMHAAKGSEFEKVLIVGCEEGLLPHSNSVESEADVEEERRLLYVAMTRARKQLTLSHVESRMTHGKVTSQVPSRFLEVLPDTVEVEKVGWAESMSMSTPSRANDFGLLGGSEDGEPVVLSVEEGDFVAHDSFGRGVVVGIRGSLVTCVFEGHGVKTITADHISTEP